MVKKNKPETAPYFYLTAGFHMSYLISFFEYSDEIDPAERFSYISKNDNGSVRNYGIDIIGQPFDYSYTTESIYNKFMYGLNTGVGFKNYVSNRIDVCAEIMGIYDIRNTDNLNATETLSNGKTFQYWRYATKFPSISDVSDRNKSHSIYVSFGFALIYYLNKDANLVKHSW
jgi:hypothetical protein